MKELEQLGEALRYWANQDCKIFNDLCETEKYELMGLQIRALSNDDKIDECQTAWDNNGEIMAEILNYNPSGGFEDITLGIMFAAWKKDYRDLIANRIQALLTEIVSEIEEQ